MNHRNHTLLFVLLISIVVISCKKDKPVKTVDLGYSYYPAHIGHYIIYDVDSIVHNDFTGTIDTFRFQLKEIIESEFEDAGGRLSQRIERYKKKEGAANWMIKNVWFSTVLNSRMERVEENIRLMKLAFPVKPGHIWDGNAFNTGNEQDYEYLSTDEKEKINNISFDSVATVLQADNMNLIERHYAEEKYARTVGLVYKEYVKLDLQKDAGLEYYARISSWGIE